MDSVLSGYRAQFPESRPRGRRSVRSSTSAGSPDEDETGSIRHALLAIAEVRGFSGSTRSIRTTFRRTQLAPAEKTSSAARITAHPSSAKHCGGRYRSAAGIHLSGARSDDAHPALLVPSWFPQRVGVHSALFRCERCLQDRRRETERAPGTAQHRRPRNAQHPLARPQRAPDVLTSGEPARGGRQCRSGRESWSSVSRIFGSRSAEAMRDRETVRATTPLPRKARRCAPWCSRRFDELAPATRRSLDWMSSGPARCAGARPERPPGTQRSTPVLFGEHR